MVPRFFTLFSLLLIVSTPACRSREWKQNLVTSRSPVAIYIEHREKDGAVVPLGFAHPPKLSEDCLKSILRGVRFHPSGFMGVSRTKTVGPLFTEEEVTVLSGAVLADLEKLGPNERLRFLLARTSWRPLALGIKGTSGVIFFDAPDRMNLAFDWIDETLPDDSGDPRAIAFTEDPAAITGKDPVIVPPPGAFLRHPGADGQAYPRWVVLDPRLIAIIAPTPPPAAPGAAAAAPPPPPPSAEESAEAVKRKLKVLDDLRKDGVINAEEYEKARQEILLQRTR